MKRSATHLVVISIFTLSLACHPTTTPDQEIRDTLSKAVEAIESGDARGATAILDDRYQGPEGMNKAATQFFLAQAFKQGKIGIHVLDQDIGVKGTDAFEKIHVVMTQQGGGLIPDGSKRTYILHWTKRGADWRIVDIQDFSDRPENN